MSLSISSFWFEFWNKAYSNPGSQKSPYKAICIEMDNNGPETIKCFRRRAREVQKVFGTSNVIIAGEGLKLICPDKTALQVWGESFV